MSLKLGTQDISGISQNTKYNAHHLLDFKWTDCIMNDVSWLRADTFSWQSGDVYTSVYNHLVQDLQGITAETETVGSYTVTFYRATDKHKVVLADQETTVLNIYNETGIAWYYVLDTTNTQFKLPRTKFGFEGLRTNVGDNIEAGLPAMTTGTAGGHNHSYTRYYSLEGAYTAQYNNGCFGGTGDTTSWNGDHTHTINTGVRTTDTVQPPATQMYLYFYVGDYSQTAIEQTAGLNAELFNSKLNIDGDNTPSKLSDALMSRFMPDYENQITGSYPSLGSWVRVTKDSFVCIWGGDSYTESFSALVSPDNGVTYYTVGRRADDYNGYTQTTSFTFFVPKNWSFACQAENGGEYRIYPLKGAQ